MTVLAPPRPLGRPRTARETIAQHWARRLTAQALASAQSRWPSPRYRDDPQGFARDVLGVELWFRQFEIVEALRTHKRIAVSSGNKSGKTLLAAVASVWWLCTRDDARVSLSAASAKQIRTGVYREIRKLIDGSGTCLACKREAERLGQIATPCEHSQKIDDVKIGLLPETGIVAADGREIIGRAARDPEAARGLSSPNVLLVLDEATGIPDEIFGGFSTAVAGGGAILAISNPTRNSGWFFEAFHGPQKVRSDWHTLTIDTRENPNYQQNAEILPGLATKEWVDGEIETHGEDSRRVAETITGRFLLRDDGRIFGPQVLAKATNAFRDCLTCSGIGYIGDDPCPDCRGSGSRGQRGYDGRLWLACDPAGADGQGDEIAFALRRGEKVFDLLTFKGEDENGILRLILQLIASNTAPKEIAHVAIDASGPIGAKLHGAILTHLSLARRNSALTRFDFLPIRPSDHAQRNKAGYVTVRDELAGSLEECIRVHGYAIPDDDKLLEELSILTWETASSGQYKLLPKKRIRQILGRSPDRYDAVSMVCWAPAHALTRALPAPSLAVAASERQRIPAPDPYRGRDIRGRGNR